MNPADAPPPEFRSLSPRGFLGFPTNRPDTPIDLDGDIVLLTGANGAGKSSLLEAIALRESGGTHRDDIEQLIYRGPGDHGSFALRFDTNDIYGDVNDLVNSPSSPHLTWWKSEPANRRRHAQTVYFHPAYLRELFEESPVASGAGFLDLLAPAPRAVDGLRTALKSTEPSIAAEIAKLERESGVLSQKEISDTRRQHVAVFNTRAAAWLPDYSAKRLVIRAGNLRSTWIGELINIAREAVSLLGERGQSFGVTELSKPSESLRVLASATRLSVPSPATQSNTTIPTIPTAALVEISRISGHDWPIAREILLAHKVVSSSPDSVELDTLRERLKSTRRLRNTLGRGEAAFPQWVADLQQRTSLWCELRLIGNPAVPLPGSFANWSFDMTKLAGSWSSIESEWSAWAAQLDDQEKQLSRELNYRETEAAKLQFFQKLADTLRPWLDSRPDLEIEFGSITDPAAFLTRFIPPAEATKAAESPSTCRAETFAQACETWANWESKVEESEARQASSEFIARSQNLARLREFHAAIKTESGSTDKSRLGQLQQEALGASLEPLENFLNEAADRFRLFDTIKPIRLSRFDKTKVGNRLALRVGEPPREISQCSSGQRSQLGLLLFLALHYGLRDTYHSRVLCLDEVTSSFDLAQIPRLALLLRQIAYAPPASPFRRRIFIASHNEAFSQRLAEMLTPPAGRSLRVVRFTGYDAVSGPIMESFQLRESQPLNAQTLHAYLSHRYGAAAHD